VKRDMKFKDYGVKYSVVPKQSPYDKYVSLVK